MIELHNFPHTICVLSWGRKILAGKEGLGGNLHIQIFSKIATAAKKEEITLRKQFMIQPLFWCVINIQQGDRKKERKIE